MKKILWIGIPSLLLVGLVVWRFTVKAGVQAALAQQQGQRQGAAAAVQVAVAGPQTLLDQLETVGTAESPFRVQISPKTVGRIEELTVRAGDSVTAGQVLVKIDPTELQGALAQAQANVAQARSRLAEAQLGSSANSVGVQSQIAQQQAALTSAQADYNQVQQSYEAQVASADSAVADAAAKVSSAKSQVGNARAQLELQKANQANAKARLDRQLELLNKGYISQQAFDDVKTAYEVQQRQVDVAQGALEVAASAQASAEAQKRSAENNAKIVRQKGKADIAAAKAKVTQAQATLNVATANKSQTKAYKENLAALQAQVNAAEAQVTQAQAKLADVSLKSAIDGVVTQRNADPGALASPGQPVLIVEFLKWLYVECALPIESSAKVKVGDHGTITFDGLPTPIEAQITNINPSADLQSRQISLLLKLDNASGAVKPGMFGKVAIVIAKHDVAVAVPREAVRKAQGVETVTVVDANNVAHSVKVLTGATDGRFTEVTSGVTAGEKVVTLSYAPIKDGQKVQPADGSERSGADGPKKRSAQ